MKTWLDEDLLVSYLFKCLLVPFFDYPCRCISTGLVPLYFITAKCMGDLQIATQNRSPAKSWQQDFRITGEAAARVYCNIYNAPLRALQHLEKSWEKCLWGKHRFFIGIMVPWGNSVCKGPQEVSSATSRSEQGQPWDQTRLFRAWSSQDLKPSNTGDCTEQLLHSPMGKSLLGKRKKKVFMGKGSP